ncbi:ribosome-associated translation inhibitor RaiA [Microvirga sp. 2MCAF38]|uniref:ribosome hibernation-promoting factor, HPF/YfiA family n=1 Tax=Microvirga sp. 2MCAF38 TaxID=3232989 RepID=UPI003F9B0465
MALRVSGKNLDIGEALRSQISERLAGALQKYFDGSYSGHVTVTKDGIGFRTDCVLHLASGATIEASGAAQGAYASFDQTAERIEKRLRRYKRRLKERPPTNNRTQSAEIAYSVFEAPTDESAEAEAYHPAIIAETTKTLHRFSVSDAVLELDMTGAVALVFIHAGTGRVNVVYRRGDGAIGWVDPPPGQG